MESELGREIVELSKEIMVQQIAHTQIICSLLNVIDRKELHRIKMILVDQAASGELQGLAVEACNVALQLVSLIDDGDGPTDIRKLLQILPGGKKD